MLDVDVTIITKRQPWTVWYYPAVIDFVGGPPSLDLCSSTPVIWRPSSILGVACTGIYNRVGTHRLWIIFPTLAVLHTRRAAVYFATGAVNHVG